MMEIKLISSLEKCFTDEKIADKMDFSKASMMKNEIFSFQLAYSIDITSQIQLLLNIDSDIKDKISVRRVRQIPSNKPVGDASDDNYLRKNPGLYPDLLEPFDNEKFIYSSAGRLEAFWFIIEPCGIVGKFPIKLSLSDSQGTVLAATTFEIEILDISLQKQELLVTNWFHCDCLASYYNIEIFSQRHWEIIENFVKTAVKYGINLILTPVLTPPLDTEVGYERPTIQLVDIKVTNGVYRYNYKKLDRWIEMCERCGVEYFEISHLFSQWGAKSAPKVMATVDGEYRKIFGWDTESTGEEYTKFLKSFLKSLLKHLQIKGVDKHCYFHISDEPHGDAIETYKACKKIVHNALKDYPIMDALSTYDFYKKGILKMPIPANNSIEPFIKNNVPNLWTYYCCGQTVDVSNQFFSMPSARNRIIGEQFYKYKIFGFLQWGYNYYYSQLSQYPINPYITTDADSAFPSGDAFKVYPSSEGTAIESIRLVVFCEALQDLRAMKLLEKLTSYDYVMDLIEDGTNGKITFSEYPKSSTYILELREKINNAIEKELCK